MRRLKSLVLAMLPTLAVGACQTPANGGDAAAPIPDPAALEARRAAAGDFQPALVAKDAALRARAVLALGRLERTDAVPLVLAALADADVGVRREAAFAAGQLDLAFSTPAHEVLRGRVEQDLVRRLGRETDAAVRAAVVRALGQVAGGAGLQTLVGVAASPGPQRAAALVALGVAGQRRGAPLAADPGLRAAIVAGLADADADVVTAAAYAAFRQRVVLDEQSLAPGLRGPPQARIHLARAVAPKEVPTAAVAAVVAALARDADWRVQVEAVRALREHPDVDVGPVLDLLPDATRRISQAGQAHVLTEACVSLAAVGAPGPALAAVELAVAGLPPGPTWTMARCTCAGVVEILGGAGNALEQCTAAAAPTTQRLLSIDTIARARISSTERAAALKGLIDDDSPKVRITVAGALCGDGSEASADVAATRLLVEEDSGVMSALLECFAGGRHHDVLKDRTLLGLVGRLQERSGFDQLEPLITVASMARGRSSAAMKDLVTSLAAHADPAVRDAAAGVAFGDRGPGARAVVLPAPSPATLPLGAVLRTTRGEILIAFDREAAPRTVKTFAELARKGVLDNTPFHRVIADFVAQGGDPRGDGSGGPGYTIPNENHAGAFVRGAVGIATAGTDTGGSQFFLTHSDQPHLDGRYTRFATVVDGLAVMDSLQREDLLLAVDFTTALRPRPDDAISVRHAHHALRPAMSMRHLRTTLDVGDVATLDALLQRAQELKRHRGQRRIAPTLAGRVIAMLFEKPSTRTRVSFQSGAALLGAHCIVLEGRDIWLNREGGAGEALRDTARVIGGSVDLIVARPQGPHATVEELARHAGVPVINGLSDRDHPCQVLTDLFTLYERREKPFGSVLAFVGDSVAMAHGYLALAALTGLELRLALPAGVEVDGELLKKAGARAKVLVTSDPVAAVTGADVVSTAAWNGPVAAGFRVDDALLQHADDDVTVLHPLPARRGEEITDEVLEGSRSVAFQQAGNRLPMQQAILEALLQ